MNYFKLNPNVASKQWEGYVNLGELIYRGEEVDDVELSNSRKPCTLRPLRYDILVDGKTAPVNTIGADFFVFDESLEGWIASRLNTCNTCLSPTKAKKCVIGSFMPTTTWIASIGPLPTMKSGPKTM